MIFFLIVLVILIFLMLMRPGVTTDDLASYLGSGCLFEILPTAVWGFMITVIHYGIFVLPRVIEYSQSSASAGSYIFILELTINGIFSILSMVTAAFLLGKSAGIGFISSVGLGCYTYYLACM